MYTYRRPIDSYSHIEIGNKTVLFKGFNTSAIVCDVGYSSLYFAGNNSIYYTNYKRKPKTHLYLNKSHSATFDIRQMTNNFDNKLYWTAGSTATLYASNTDADISQAKVLNNDSDSVGGVSYY